MKRLVVLVILASLLPILVIGCTKNEPIKSSSVTDPATQDVIVDKDYLLALNAVDNFLCAWLNRDQQRGAEFITQNLKNSLKDEGLFAFFVGTSNPHHQGFEVLGKERIDKTTIRFNVWLYEYYTGENPTPTKRGAPKYVDVVKFDEYRWLVSTLPQ